MSQRAVVQLLVWVLCGAALTLIAIIATGSGVDETGGRAIGTAAGLAFFSLTGVAGYSLAARRPVLRPIGYLTVALSAAAFLLGALTLWTGEFSGDRWRPAVYAGILAFAFGHAAAMLAAARDEDTDAVRAARAGTLLALLLLVALVFVEIAEPGPDIGVRTIGIVAVVYMLGVALVPLLRRASRATGEPEPVRPPRSRRG